MLRVFLPLGVTLLLALFCIPAKGADGPRPSQHTVAGTVVRVEPQDSTLVIRETGFLGRFRIQVKSYRVKKPSQLAHLSPGDKVSGVYFTKDGLLHGLRSPGSQPPRRAP